MSIDGKRRIASAAFVALLVLSVFWPAPVIAVNDVCCDAALPIDELSFLGREAPSWDVVFWFFAGLLTIAMLQSAEWRPADFKDGWRMLRSMRVDRAHAGKLAVALAVSAVAVTVTWRYADAAVTAWAESVASAGVEDFIRIFNRFGGGMNPALIIGFFLLAGTIYRRRLWVGHAVAMAAGGLAAGILAQIVKYLVGRTRPELWLGPFSHARTSATSFPSGHTVGAFALAAVLVTRSRSPVLRAVAAALAIAVGMSRILAFRHWTSDVVASALIGATIGWIAAEVTVEAERDVAPRADDAGTLAV